MLETENAEVVFVIDGEEMPLVVLINHTHKSQVRELSRYLLKLTVQNSYFASRNQQIVLVSFIVDYFESLQTWLEVLFADCFESVRFVKT